MDREQIIQFFKDVVVDGISRDVVFPELQEQGRLEVELVAPPIPICQRFT